ncbi:MAG: hypothetical protein ACFCGT_24915 [Sandaracinaceae bacterium]
MSEASAVVRQDAIDLAVSAVVDHPTSGPIADLCFDVLTRQAEGRTLFAGREYVQGRAAEHGVTDGSTSAGDVVAVLERGARAPRERALVAAFAVLGLHRRLADDEPGAAGPRLLRFVRHADWLELCTPYVVYPFVDALMPTESAETLWREVARVVADDASGADGGRPEVRARNVGRISALAASSSTVAGDLLGQLRSSSAIDGGVRAIAASLAPTSEASEEEPAETSTPRLSGQVVRRARHSSLRLLRVVTGWALLSALARGVAFLVGVRRRGDLWLEDGSLALELRTELLGRTVWEGRERWSIVGLSRVGRAVRYPSLHLLIGVVALSVGVIGGGLLLFDGVRSGELILLTLALGLAGAGALLDLLLDVLWPGARGRVTVELSTRDGRRVQLSGVDLEEADRFLHALRREAA